MFDSIIGHSRIKKQLEQDVAAHKFHQAYLFSGPEHVGKMAMLRDFVSQIRAGESFDLESVFGKQILVGQGPGLISFLDDGETLKVAEIRKVVDFVSRRTAEGQISFCVIEHVERMTRSAANAFLKILEEPSERFVYLMTTREEKKLLPTIRSRVQFFRFTSVPPKEVEKLLHAQENNEVKIQEVMKLAVGRIGLAVSMLEDEALFERLRELYDYAMVLFEDDLVDRFTLAEHLSKKEFSEADLSQFLVYLALKMKREGSQRYLKQLDRVQQLKRWFEDTQVNKRLHLEELFISL